MFVRKKKNKSGTISVQVIEKRHGKSVLIKTIGSATDEVRISKLILEAKQFVQQFGGQRVFLFEDEKAVVDSHFNALQSFRLIGPELLLGRIFDEIGFNQITDELFRHLVLTRLVYPVSKLKTTDYLYKYNSSIVDVERIYRYLDKLHSKQKELIQQISYDHTIKILGGKLSVVFYDVTTLYFESEDTDELRKTGFQKKANISTLKSCWGY